VHRDSDYDAKWLSTAMKNDDHSAVRPRKMNGVKADLIKRLQAMMIVEEQKDDERKSG